MANTPKKLVLDRTTIKDLSVTTGVKTGTSWILCGVTPGCTNTCNMCTVRPGTTTSVPRTKQ